MKPELPVDVNDPYCDDPILDELGQIREDFSDMFNGDLKAMERYLVEEDRKLPPERFSARLPMRVNGFGASDEHPGG